MASEMPTGPAKSTAPHEGAAAADRSVAPGAVAAKPSFTGESEYEQQRRQNMARNAQMLAALGLEGAGCSFSGVKRSAEPRRAERRPIQRSRISLRHAGLGVDAVQEDVDAALLEAAASARPAPSRITERYEGGGRAEPLSEDQRDRLALAACGWLERMHSYYEPRISETNLQMVMARVRELVRGEGVALPRLEGRALEGCPVAITDDLVALREDAKVYAKWDVGGWRLNHPIGKLIAFQRALYNEEVGSGPAAEPAVAAERLSSGARVEVTMDEEGMYGARYAGAVVETDDSRALVEFDELFEHDGDGAPKLREWVGGAALRPPPPRARGFEARLRPGAPVDLWHNGGWWEVEIIGRAGSGFDVQSPVFPELKRAGVEAATLRPRWALIDGRQWLAMPPLGFKADLGTSEIDATELCKCVLNDTARRRKEEVEARRAAKEAAIEARRAERRETAAAKEAARAEAAEARRAVRAAAAAAKEVARKEAAAAKRKSAPESAGDTVRGQVLAALRKGLTARDDIVAFVARSGLSIDTTRGAVVTVLGREHFKAQPRWEQRGATYKLLGQSKKRKRA